MCQNNFHLCTESFEQNSNSKEDFFERIEKLHSIKLKLNDFQDKVCTKSDIYSIAFLDGKLLCELMYTPNNILNQNYKTMLIDIFDRVKAIDDTTYTLIGLHPISQPDIIYTEDELMQYYYNKIGTIYGEDQFTENIKKYFPKIVFQRDIQDTLKTIEGKGLCDFTKTIIHCLKHLQDSFDSIYKEADQDMPNALKRFSTLVGIETTLEGKVARKPDFTFSFENDQKQTIQICCEPHIKFSKADNIGDTEHYWNRLHFAPKHPNITKGNVLVGHIGGHL